MNVSYTQISNNTYIQPSQKTIDFRVKYKTQKCRYWTSQGFCPYGQTCAFAHDNIQMRQKATIHSRYKTKLCNNYAKTGFCRYGDRCLFLHAKTKTKKQTRDRDRERTRSNSPVSNYQKKNFNNPDKNRKNLIIFENYGIDILSSHLGIKSSRLLQKRKQEIQSAQQNNFKQVKDILMKQGIRKNRINSM